jgi:BASS family bile acid:Na+ symporter
MHPEVQIGIMLVSLCPGGVMSNYFSARSGGNVALSSVLTLTSSTLVPVSLPLGLFIFMQLQGSTGLEVDTEILKSISLLTFAVIVPALILGQLLKKLNVCSVAVLSKYLKISSMLLVGLIVIGALIENRHLLVSEFSTLFPAAFALNAVLIVVGYTFGYLLKQPEKVRRTLAIELGIQNATVVLVIIPTLFPHQPGVFNTAAFWGVLHLISGIILSSYWSLTNHKLVERVLR